jgi:hypothetical protein
LQRLIAQGFRGDVHRGSSLSIHIRSQRLLFKDVQTFLASNEGMLAPSRASCHEYAIAITTTRIFRR